MSTKNLLCHWILVSLVGITIGCGKTPTGPAPGEEEKIQVPAEKIQIQRPSIPKGNLPPKQDPQPDGQ